MTGYAVSFNLRHGRVGHLFQNRYKAIICKPEEYLRTLVPYIHLNPLRAKLVGNLSDLKNYSWCGHAAVMDGVSDGILARPELLLHYGDNEGGAVESYMRDMAEKAAEQDSSDLPMEERPSHGKASNIATSEAGSAVLDGRVLGDPAFVEEVLKGAGENGSDFRLSHEESLSITERLCGVNPDGIFNRSRAHEISSARAVYCCLCVEKGGASGVELSKKLGISRSGISRLALRGRAILAGLKKSQQLNNVPT